MRARKRKSVRGNVMTRATPIANFPPSAPHFSPFFLDPTPPAACKEPSASTPGDTRCASEAFRTPPHAASAQLLRNPADPPLHYPFAPEMAAPPPAFRLRVLSFNVWGVPIVGRHVVSAGVLSWARPDLARLA